MKHSQERTLREMTQDAEFHRRQKASLQTELEALIDRHGIATVLEAVTEVCNLKAAHIAENWQDMKLAKTWERVARLVEKYPFDAAIGL